jgi:hypothetical protein
MVDLKVNVSCLPAAIVFLSVSFSENFEVPVEDNPTGILDIEVVPKLYTTTFTTPFAEPQDKLAGENN